MLRTVQEMEKPKNLCMTYGHELRGLAGGSGGTGQRGAKGKNQDNYSSIINKIYLTIKEMCLV